MAIDLQEGRIAAAGGQVGPVARRAGVRVFTAWLLVSVLTGLAGGALTHSLVTAGGGAASRIARTQADRAEAMVEAYERSWMRTQPTEARIRITGTGAGLAWVAAQQAAWAEHAITGTGPGLTTVARAQTGYERGTEPAGTGPGLERLPGPPGSDVAVTGMP